MLYFISKLNAYVEDKDVEVATIKDMRKADFSWEDCGCKKIDREVDDKESMWEVYQYTNPMSYEDMLECETDLSCISYWDGNNWQTDIWESGDMLSFDEYEIKELFDKRPSPAYYFVYGIKIEGEEIETTQSNCSGSISPYYFVDDNIE
jgi:hypothetical protein